MADLPTWTARALSLALVLLAVARALTLGGEYYDAYETRLAARTLLGWDTGFEFPVYRSPLLIAASVVFESLGRRAGWVGPALLSAVAYAGLVTSTELLARRLDARPWVAATAGLLCALDLAAWSYAGHGLPDVPAAALCALVLATLARPGEWVARPVLLGLLVGGAALARHNVGLVGLALLAGVTDRAALRRVLLAGAVAVAVYLVATTALFAWAGVGVDGHRAMLELQRAQLAENRVNLGQVQPPAVALAFVVVGSPWLALLAPFGALLALRRGAPLAARACALWVTAHLLFASLLAGHVEARYLLPALPALAALAAVALEELPLLGWSRAAALAVLAIAAVPLGVRGPYAMRHALDPVTLDSVPVDLAEKIERARGPEGRVFWTSQHPHPAAPAVIFDPGTPFHTDPWQGIYHLGPVVLAYHLERPVTLLPRPSVPLFVRDVVRGARLADGSPAIRVGDVVLRTWDERATTLALQRRRGWGPVHVYRVVRGADGLDVELVASRP